MRALFENQALGRLVSALADLLLINVAFTLGYVMRYELNIGGEVLELNYVAYSEYVPVQLMLSVIMMATLAVFGLYRLPRGHSFFDEVTALVGAVGFGTVLSLAAVFLTRGYTYSRWMFVFITIGAILLLIGARLVRNLAKALARRRGIGVERVLVVGGGDMGHMLMHVITTEPALGYSLVGFVSENGATPRGRFSPLGSLNDLDSVLDSHDVDEVMIALPSAYRRMVPELVERFETMGVQTKVVPDLFEMSLTRVNINDLRGVPLIGVKRVQLTAGDQLTKRVLDLAVAVTIVAVLSPLWLLLGLAIKLDSRGPVLFRQLRVGRNGKNFYAYKFRSMRQNAEAELSQLQQFNEASGPLFKMRHDPRVTRVGRWLRRTSLDEMPQLLNVLRGEMSLVGPRPPVPAEVDLYEPWHRRRLEVQPGMTGLWQVSGRSEVPFDEMVMLDIYYIENWTLALDFKILLRTVPAVVSARGAY
jgi:exopolysaccharide biosynthesis polyprenyl glycosylphosphotransferase